LTSILIIEDHPDIAKIIKLGATNQGYKAFCAPNVLNAQEILRKQTIDLIILDWMLPGQTGLAFLKDLKAHNQYQKIPVVMLTCMAQEEQKIAGLEAGADDYVIKPFSNKELFLRIANILKKQNIIKSTQNMTNQSQSHLTDSPDFFNTIYFSMDLKNKKIWANSILNISNTLNPTTNLDTNIREVKQDHHPSIAPYNKPNTLLDLSPTEFKLLGLFIQYPEQVFSRDQLLDQVWKDSTDVQDRTVDVHIKRLRQNIKSQTQDDVYAQAIQTVRGFGYRLLNDTLN
jgi:two-component system, OmpR family, phosphate regulon response regulator PhoB